MLCWKIIVGGLLIMMGQHDRSEALATTSAWKIRFQRLICWAHWRAHQLCLCRERLEQSYSETGDPSIDPELLLRILLIGYLYGITSERKLVEELRMHLVWRWFTGLGFDQRFHITPRSPDRHGRFQESKLFEQLFEQIVRQCVEVWLVQGTHLSVDDNFIEANAAKRAASRVSNSGKRRKRPKAREYLVELEQQYPPKSRSSARPSVDHGSRFHLRHQGRTPARLGYYDDYLVDNHSCVIVGVQATAARMSQETVAHKTCSLASRNGKDESQNR